MKILKINICVLWKLCWKLEEQEVRCKHSPISHPSLPVSSTLV